MDQVHAPDNTFGAALIGVILASVLYGVSFSQVFFYFNNYAKSDPLKIQAVVVIAWVSDTVHQALICHTIYSYLIRRYSQQSLVWSLLVEVIFNGITAFLVQSYLAARIWTFSKGNVPIAVTLAVFILGEFVAVIVYAVKSLSMTTFLQLKTLKLLSMVVNALAVAADVLITVASCILLLRYRRSIEVKVPQHPDGVDRSGRPMRKQGARVSTMVNLLITFIVPTGMLPSLCAIASLISISLFPDTFLYISFYFILGRLYCNSFLATLNVRNAIRSRLIQIPIPHSTRISQHISPAPGLQKTQRSLGDQDGRDLKEITPV